MKNFVCEADTAQTVFPSARTEINVYTLRLRPLPKSSTKKKREFYFSPRHVHVTFCAVNLAVAFFHRIPK